MFANHIARPYFEIVNTELVEILKDEPHGLTVLDVGCGSGLHGSVLQERYGHRVADVDSSSSSVAKAQSRLWQAHVADASNPSSYPFADSVRFDLVVFSDILEHMYAPDRVLTEHLALLKPGGQALISIPNIAIWHARMRLICGRFDYEDTGTFDRTHIRFFTRRTLRELLHNCGLEVVRTRTTPGVVRPFVPLVKRFFGHDGAVSGAGDSSAILDSKPYRMYTRYMYPLEATLCGLWPTLLAFQFVILARRRRERS